MGYRLTCRYDEKSDFIDPRMIVSLLVPGGGEPAEVWNIPFTNHALEMVMVYAQKWMLENVYNQPCGTTEEAKARELNTDEVEFFVRVNRRGRTALEVEKKTAMTRLIVAAARHGLKITEDFDIVEK